MFERTRDALIALRDTLGFAPDWIVALVILGLSATLSLGVHALALHVLRLIFARRRYGQSVLAAISAPIRAALVVLGLGIALPIAPFEPETGGLLTRLLLLTAIGLVGWAAITALNTAASLYLLRFRLDSEDNLLARKHVTQVRILLRTLDTVLIVLTLGAALMTFDAVRQYGVSLLASAGVAGLVIGLAARPVLSNLLAGVQLAVTQPIRIDDVVLVEKEFGWIEEITSTYVVVRLWDLRRMVVPLTYFIEKPFQNWTREGSALIGSVELHLDYAAPIDRIREKAREIVEQSSLWDQQVFNLQVTDAGRETIELRILASSNSASNSWDLRCELREKLIAFVAREHPGALPRRRQITETASNPNGEVQNPPSSIAHAGRRSAASR